MNDQTSAGQTTPFPLNRVVAFLGPFVAIAAGAAASWLGRHFPGLHLNTAKAAGQIAQAIEFAIGALVTLVLHHKWLDGWQQWEEATLAPAATADASAPTQMPLLTPPGDYDPSRDMPPPLEAAPVAQLGGGE
jgi:hypothetical protein